MDLLPTGLTPREAIDLQRRIAGLIVSQPLPAPRKGLLVAGVDCSYEKQATQGFAAIVVCEWPGLDTVEIAGASAAVSFPYVPGLLSFRELPLLDLAWKNLQRKPDIIVVDGQGKAHPRRCGVASHAGLLWNRATIGCAKSLLAGAHGRLGEDRGNRAALRDQGEVIGAAVRTRSRTNPVYISTGHLCDLASAVRWILRLAPRYRLPEVIRRAHQEVNRMRREA
jgi:deoxyribonuclease V